MELSNNMIITPEFRVNYPALLEPKEDLNGNLKYSVEALFYDAKALDKMKKLCQDAILQTWGKNPPSGLKLPFKSGDDSAIKEYHGKIYCRFRSTYAVRVVGPNKQPITDESQIYPGMWGRAIVTCKAYNMQLSKGVSFYLNLFQKIRDDEPAFQIPMEDFLDDLPDTGTPWDEIPF